MALSEKLERHCTMLLQRNEAKGPPPTAEELTADLESSDVAKKREALKALITLMIQGENMERLLMTVIRFCLTVEDHTIQKLLQMYWEVVDKYSNSGDLRPEMILVWCAPRDVARPSRRARGCGRLPRLTLAPFAPVRPARTPATRCGTT